jgi:cohesin complex subunit SCC1
MPWTSHPSSPIISIFHALSVVMRLLEIREDPISHFLPTKVTPKRYVFLCGTSWHCARVAGDVYATSCDIMFHPASGEVHPQKNPQANVRVSNQKAKSAPCLEDDGEPGQARRASVAPSQGVGSEILGRESVGPGIRV